LSSFLFSSFLSFLLSSLPSPPFFTAPQLSSLKTFPAKAKGAISEPFFRSSRAPLATPIKRIITLISKIGIKKYSIFFKQDNILLIFSKILFKENKKTVISSFVRREKELNALYNSAK
jgi:hypothetical protein